jgi:hypothetical protein
VERQLAWKAAHHKTVRSLTESGRWPVDIPIPLIAE